MRSLSESEDTGAHVAARRRLDGRLRKERRLGGRILGDTQINAGKVRKHREGLVDGALKVIPPHLEVVLDIIRRTSIEDDASLLIGLVDSLISIDIILHSHFRSKHRLLLSTNVSKTDVTSSVSTGQEVVEVGCSVVLTEVLGIHMHLSVDISIVTEFNLRGHGRVAEELHRFLNEGDETFISGVEKDRILLEEESRSNFRLLLLPGQTLDLLVGAVVTATFSILLLLRSELGRKRTTEGLADVVGISHLRHERARARERTATLELLVHRETALGEDLGDGRVLTNRLVVRQSDGRDLILSLELISDREFMLGRERHLGLDGVRLQVARHAAGLDLDLAEILRLVQHGGVVSQLVEVGSCGGFHTATSVGDGALGAVRRLALEASCSGKREE